MDFIYKHKVGYAETDQMGFMHHSNYARVFENARWELFRSNGISYKTIEQEGVLMPVVDMELKYLKPAFYDDELSVEVSVSAFSGAKICFNYKVKNSEMKLINTGKTTLAFIEKSSKKPIRVPAQILKVL